MSECRSCGAPVVWGQTDKGKPCPFDPDTGESHFKTCPHAPLWSRKATKPWGYSNPPWVECPPALFEKAKEELRFEVTEKKWSRGSRGPQIVTTQVVGLEGNLVPPGWAMLNGASPPETAAGKRRELRDYQKPAIDALLGSWCGVFVAPCGAGKTVIGCELVRRLGRETLILVHTKDLMSQWERELEVVCPGAPVRVETFQKLTRSNAPIRADLLIVDEGHHVAAETFLDVVQRVRCFRRYGLTATPEREDGYTQLMHWWLGPTIFELTHEDIGALRPKIYPLITEWDWESMDNGLDHSAMITSLLEDDSRNWWIGLAIQKQFFRFGGSHLIITQRKAHVQRMAEIIHQCTGEKVAAITSELSKKRRVEILDRVRSGEIRFLVATQLADEGLDVPCLDTGWIVAPTKAKGRTIQRVGRMLRPREGKNHPVIFDLVDKRVRSLWKQWLKRSSAMRKIGEVMAPITLEEIA